MNESNLKFGRMKRLWRWLFALLWAFALLGTTWMFYLAWDYAVVQDLH